MTHECEYTIYSELTMLLILMTDLLVYVERITYYYEVSKVTYGYLNGLVFLLLVCKDICLSMLIIIKLLGCL